MRKNLALLLLLLCLGAALSFYPVPGVTAEDKEKNVCEVHQVPFVAGSARVVYGLSELPFGAYYKVKAKRFPNSNLEINGGCVIDLEHPENNKTVADVLYCPKCRIAEARWLVKHPKK